MASFPYYTAGNTSSQIVETQFKQRLVAAAPMILIMFFTLIFRSTVFGNPDVDFDEPFYLLVGERMLHGDLVYVDIWDRKPVGLFLLYSFAAAWPGNMFVNYLLLAAVFAGGTGLVIWKICCRYVGRWTAILPAIFYVIWQEPYNGGGGQSAIFYNLLTAITVYLALRIGDKDSDISVLRYGAIAMFVMGLAIQIKYTVIPEGIFFGCYFLWQLWRRGKALLEIAVIAVGYATTALIPTIAVSLFYLTVGHFDEFLYANFISVFERDSLVFDYVRDNLTYILMAGLPLIAVGLMGLARLGGVGETETHRDAPVLFGWSVAAALGFLMISNFYWYYFMPLLLTLSILTAPLLRKRLTAVLIVILLTAWPLWISDTPSWKQTVDRKASIAALTRIISPYVGSSRNCLYVFDGPSSLYLTTHSCLPSRFAYPDHLSNDVERTGLGVDSAAEMRRVMHSRPGAIVMAETKVVPILNRANVDELRTALESNYQLAGRIRHGWRMIRVYVRNDLYAKP